LKSSLFKQISPHGGSRQIPRDEVEKLKDRIDELESENDALQDHIDSISDIISGEDEDDDKGED
jgi:hypothetical protein